MVIFSAADGFYEFNELDADTYDIFAIKMGFKCARQMVEMKDFGENNIGIKLKSIQEEQKRDLVEDKKGTDTPHPTPNKSEETKPEAQNPKQI